MSTDATGSVDPVTQEVLRHKFDSIAEEMETSLLRSAYSSIVKEAQDASTALFDPTGRVVAQAAALPAHLGMLIPAVETIVDTFPLAEMGEGDIYAMNDPYNGGTHLPDIIVVKPIVHDDEVVMLAASLCHHQDIGGKVPGSQPTDATEIYQEGLQLPPLKLYDGGDPDRTILEIIRKNVRIPDTVTGDLEAQVAAANTADRRIQEVAAEHGTAEIAAAVDALIDHGEELTRGHLETIPDGEYTFHDYLDDDGITHHEPIRIQATVQVEGSDVAIDFTGTADQVAGPVNCVPAATLSAVYYVVRAVTDPEIPTNAGCFAPVSAHLPPRSLVNPDPPAPVSLRTITFKRVAEVLLGALAKAIPEKVRAASSGQLAGLTFGGSYPDGSQWVYGDTLAGGNGARPTKDGIECLDSDLSNCMNVPVEAAELEYPLRVRRYELWEDSGGPGKYRGGLGCRKQFEVSQDAVTLSHRRDRHDFHPWGVNGGKAAPTCKTIIRRGDEEESIPSKTTVELDEGDVVDVYATGGGGFGSPSERSLEAVERDLRRGKISEASAEREYAVAVGETGELDVEQSRSRREESTTAPEQTTVFDRGDGPDADQD